MLRTIITALLLTLALQQPTNLNPDVTQTPGSERDLPNPSPPATFGKAFATISNWDQVLKSSFGAGTKWAGVDDSFSVQSKGYVSVYELSFHVNCLTGPAIFKISATGATFILMGGKWIL